MHVAYMEVLPSLCFKIHGRTDRASKEGGTPVWVTNFTFLRSQTGSFFKEPDVQSLVTALFPSGRQSPLSR